ncbi:thioredoxin-like domain-containing protein [Dysgonomonas massiliensis]|uniref:thioredoxin-like domain-containing protein n=1 Tax=Dysgonomonas massiliensis TaxID=2040292 RepID=UPI000C7621AD|nr:DUF4369 domain-containing protein [Dysgonomonas massiliensis]
MKISTFSRFCVLALLLLGAVSCSDKNKGPHFTLEGVVSDADSTTLYLEMRSIDAVSVIDSVKLDKEGEFEFKQTAPQYGEFYLLRLGNQAINIAVDSTETIKINASKAKFATDYTVEGSLNSSKIKDITLAQNKLMAKLRDLNYKFAIKDISQIEYASQVQSAIADYKTLAEAQIRNDYASLSSYFALFQKVGDLLIFDLYDKKDRSLFQAAATGWKFYRPESPRTEQMERLVLSVLKDIRDKEDSAKQIEEKAVVIDNQTTENYYNMTLTDKKGQKVELASLIGKPVVLDFTSYSTEYSPVHNIKLNNLYLKYKSQFEIYQVSFDVDNHTWLNSASNLPWITVRESSVNSNLVTRFNIQGFPTTYLISSKGEIVKRLLPNDDFEAELKKVL